MEQSTIKVKKCNKCGAVFKEGLDRCPECKSRRVVSYEMPNPVSRLPMEAILNVAGHFLWMLGVAGFIALVWKADSPDSTQNWLMALAGFGFLLMSIIASVALFGLGEILRRIIRIQRRVRAFVREYYESGLGGHAAPSQGEQSLPDQAFEEAKPSQEGKAPEEEKPSQEGK